METGSKIGGGGGRRGINFPARRDSPSRFRGLLADGGRNVAKKRFVGHAWTPSIARRLAFIGIKDESRGFGFTSESRKGMSV